MVEEESIAEEPAEKKPKKLSGNEAIEAKRTANADRLAAGEITEEEAAANDAELVAQLS